MKEQNYSVLMSVYSKDNPEFLRQSIDSIINQTIQTNDFVIVCDGPLTEELEKVILYYKRTYHFIKILRLNRNCGLGIALNFGLSECKNELIGRMDSDDISVQNRFEIQLNYMKEHVNVSVLGGYISEFYSSFGDIEMIRKVPKDESEIKKMITKRNPMNHVTIMFRKTDIMNVGGYKHLPYLEDYYLWLRLLIDNKRMRNISDNLVYVRTGREMYKRRGNKLQIKGWLFLQREMKKYRMVNSFEILLHMIEIIGFVYTPSKLKEIVYKRKLRN